MTEKNFWDEYNEYREKMNERVMETDNLNIKRFFNLDTRAYDDGALDKKTKEMLGLVASLVLKCDDCINYHMQELYKLNIIDEELYEVLNIGLIVGGSIIIPHLRKTLEAWDKLGEKDE